MVGGCAFIFNMQIRECYWSLAFRVTEQVQYLRVHRLSHVVVCVVCVFPGKDDDFTGTISQQLQFLGRTRN